MVSWNDAADNHESVASDAFVIPMSSGRPSAGRLFDSTRLAVLLGVAPGVDLLAGQERAVARLRDGHPPQHLADDHLDVLVVDRHALVAVHVLHLVDEVLLGLAHALDLEQLLRVERALLVADQTVAGLHVLAVAHTEVRTTRHRVLELGAVVADDRDDLLALLVLAEPDHSGDVGHQRRALRGAGLEQLDHAGQTVGDVLTRDTTGVERTHRELGSRLTDRLRGDDTDRLAEIGDLAGREHAAVAARAHTRHRLAGEHRTHTHTRDVRVVGDQVHPVVVDLGVARDDGAVGEREVFGEATTEQARLEQTPALGAGQHVLDPDAADRVALDLADDQLLRDVDESTGQVAGVGGTERGVGETLACTVRRDEVLEHREALTEVALDRARDDLTARVGDETTHTGDLTHLHDVSSGARADHHVDRVELASTA